MKKAVALFLLLSSLTVSAQKKSPWSFLKEKNRESHTGQFYFYWGYNRAYYSKSNIHLSGPEYDFTVYKAKAHDRPTPISDEAYINPGLMTIPQFNFRLGYQINNKWSVSAGWDHMKYVMDQNQVAEISGVINHPDFSKYNGSYLRTPMVIGEDLLKFEHTDGLNVVSVDIERRFPLYRTGKGLLSFHSISGLGTAIVVPRSDVRVCGVGLNNNWHISGYHINVKTGIRMEFLRNGFLQLDTRAGYVNLPDVLIQNDASHRANHSFFFLEWYGALGMYFKVF